MVDRRSGHLDAGSFHKDAAGYAELLGALVGAGHLVGGVEPHGVTSGFCSSGRTTQTATAESSEWVMDIWSSSSRTPTILANRSILPKMRTVGASRRRRITSTPFHWMRPQPRAFVTASFAAQRPA